MASGTGCSWKIVGSVGSARKEKAVLSAACLLLLVPTPGWEQQAKGTGFLVVPLHLLICVRSGTCPWAQPGWSVQALHSQRAESQNSRMGNFGRDHSGSPGATPLLRQGQWLKNPRALPGVLCSPTMPDMARGTHRGCCWCWQCHTELTDDLEQQKHRGRHSLSLLWKAVPQHIRPSSFLCRA